MVDNKLNTPSENSVNQFIDPGLCSVSYVSFDQTIEMIQKMGRGRGGGVIVQNGLPSAFMLLPIYPADFSLLGMCIDDQFYIDKYMSFGCSIAPLIFRKFS